MALQWYLIAVFLYGEIGVITLLLLPFISPARWQSIFRSSLVQKCARLSNISFNVFIAILLVMVMDAIREVRKYAGPMSVEDLKNKPNQENLAHMRLFIAQRNLYIAGLALFFWFIIRRLVTLVSLQAQLTAQSETSQTHARSASRKQMEEKARSDDTDVDAVKGEEDLATQLDETEQELEKIKKELEEKQTDFDALKKQSESTNKEYNRLLNEYSKARVKIEELTGVSKT
ncbi:B-cell receptor-associated protein 31-like [Mya arenaria]|uniref:B-cell receptor-associated protein 31-like n=1 Tax=Mya arenaria TaxID=6604 RepID=UPI0022E78DAE|nr:B-cell receptor-associated protein 31-like [Mya arenaria]